MIKFDTEIVRCFRAAHRDMLWLQDIILLQQMPTQFPDCLKVTAFTEDGEVMAVQHKEYPIYGVQFHPESIMTPDGKTNT